MAPAPRGPVAAVESGAAAARVAAGGEGGSMAAQAEGVEAAAAAASDEETDGEARLPKVNVCEEVASCAVVSSMYA